MMIKQIKGGGSMKCMRGFALLDVIIAILIFAVGMLALASLQTNLTRSSVDANTRTVAANVGEEILERLRTFRRVSTDPDGVIFAFADIDKAYVEGTVKRGGIDYTVTGNVTGYDFNEDKTAVTATYPAVAGSIYDLKLVELNVAWDNNQSFQVDETQQVSNTDMNTGFITIKAVIPSIPSLATAAVASTDEGLGGVLVNYTPGENPDTIKLTLSEAGKKFKEATAPLPAVIRGDKVETWFDVVTYSQVNPQATFLRREEFLVVSCECELETAPAPADYGLKPTLWNGIAYTEGEKVEKWIGTAPNNVQQSEFCGICCRDHHDGNGNTAEEVYDRANAGGQDTDHGHYASGNIITTPVGDGDRYLEACRLVRKDGFMRVTQDARQSTLVGFPEGYLELDEGADEYSDYVIAAVDEYYTGTPSQTALPQPNPPDEASWLFSARDSSPAMAGADLPAPPRFLDNQQLSSRAIYTDYLTSAAQKVVSDCFPSGGGGPNQDCLAPGASSPLEIYPFFDLQMTKLASWQNESGSNLVTVTSQPIEDGNTHSRGKVELSSPASSGRSTILISSENGNLGLTSTGPIDPTYVVNEDRLYVDANLNSTPMPPIGGVVSGPLTSAIKRKPAGDLTLTPSSNIYCGNTNTQWSCVVGTPGTLTVGEYSLNGLNVYICSDLTGRIVGANTTTFNLPASGGSFRIWVTTDSSCSPP